MKPETSGEPRRSSPGRAGVVSGLACLVLVASGLLASAAPASAQIVSASREGASSSGLGGLRLVLGAGAEFSSDSEETDIEYPVTLEYNVTEQFKLIVESSYATLRPKAKDELSSNSMGDLETFIEAEVISERRYRPALTIESGIKWPTADAPDFGTGERDYAFGLVASKDFVTWDVDLGGTYTWVGSPPGQNMQNVFELSLASEVQLSHVFSVVGEGVYTFGGATTFRRGGGLGGTLTESGGGFEYALGLDQKLGRHLQLEEGVVIQPDGAWQGVIFAEWDFVGD